MATEYLVQEEDGTSRITLEDGTGFILLEESDSAGGVGGAVQIHHYYHAQ